MEFRKGRYFTILKRMVLRLDENIKNHKKREIIEETINKLDIGEDDLKNLERVRKNLWKKEKLKS